MTKVIPLVDDELQKQFIQIASRMANLEKTGLEGAQGHWQKINQAYISNGSEGVTEYCKPYMKKYGKRNS